MVKLPKIELSQKPHYIRFATDIDFYGLFEKIESQFENCFLLESLIDDVNQSRYSIIGFDPQQILRANGKTLYVNEKAYNVENPYEALRQIVPQYAIARMYAGGLVGYIGYDSLEYFESSMKIQKNTHFDQFMFGVYTDGLVYDNLTQELFYFYYDENRISQVEKIVQKVGTYSYMPVHTKFLRDTMTKEEHTRQVKIVKEHVRAGDTFQCVIGFKKEYEIKGNTFELYTKLRKVNPSPYMYYVKFGKKKIIGASPELLFRLRNGEMETYPLAGTIKRGKTKAEDQKLARELLNDPKEIAEHNMLIDLHRNDIGRVAQFGTVKVRSQMDIKKFSHVQHISSEIAGIKRVGEDMFSCLAANFPAGTLSGAPKIESMKIIDRIEKDGRGPYGGAIGHFGFNGDCTFAIPIRTLFIDGEYGFIQAGSGIVYDSIAEKEYDEVLRKMGAITQVLQSL
jgi:anthranilate synthase component 1